MTPQSQPVIDLPKFDTGQYQGCVFLMSDGDAQLSIHVAELKQSPIRIHFDRVRWHLFTALYNCSRDQVTAYFQLIEILNSSALIAYVAADSAPKRAYRELHHYRIFLDETGCHELYAQSCHVNTPMGHVPQHAVAGAVATCRSTLALDGRFACQLVRV